VTVPHRDRDNGGRLVAVELVRRTRPESHARALDPLVWRGNQGVCSQLEHRPKGRTRRVPRQLVEAIFTRVSDAGQQLGAAHQSFESSPGNHRTAERTRLLEEALQRVLAFAVLLLPVGGALLVSFVFTPAAIEAGAFPTPPCTFKTVFGIPCLSCGMTRAFSALSHGQLALAWSYNRLSPVFYVAFWGLALWGGWGLGRAVWDWVRLKRGL
jgi:hypothetical protein